MFTNAVWLLDDLKVCEEKIVFHFRDDVSLSIDRTDDCLGESGGCNRNGPRLNHLSKLDFYFTDVPVMR